MEKYRDANKDLHMVFINLERLWWVLEKKGVPLKYTKLIKDLVLWPSLVRVDGVLKPQEGFLFCLDSGLGEDPCLW